MLVVSKQKTRYHHFNTISHINSTKNHQLLCLKNQHKNKIKTKNKTDKNKSKNKKGGLDFGAENK